MSNYLQYIKYGIILAAVCACIWFVKDYADKADFKKDTQSNDLQNARFDSLRIKYIKYNDGQMMDALKRDTEKSKLLEKYDISLKRVNSIMTHLLKYRDTTIVNTNLNPILSAINNKQNMLLPIRDSTACLLIKGNIQYKNGVLGLNITDRVFFDHTTAIGYWERRQWSFLGIKTRFLGKRQGTAKVIDRCGESTIIQISKSE
jgi:hypothetical protein